MQLLSLSMTDLLSLQLSNKIKNASLDSYKYRGRDLQAQDLHQNQFLRLQTSSDTLIKPTKAPKLSLKLMWRLRLAWASSRSYRYIIISRGEDQTNGDETLVNSVLKSVFVLYVPPLAVDVSLSE